MREEGGRGEETDLAEGHDKDCEAHHAREDFGEEHEHSRGAVFPSSLRAAKEKRNEISSILVDSARRREEYEERRTLHCFPNPIACHIGLKPQ